MEFSPRAAELTTLLESRMTNFYTNFQVEPASFRHSFPQLPQLLVCSGSFRTPDRCNRSTKPNYSFTPLIIPHSPSPIPDCYFGFCAWVVSSYYWFNLFGQTLSLPLFEKKGSRTTVIWYLLPLVWVGRLCRLQLFIGCSIAKGQIIDY